MRGLSPAALAVLLLAGCASTGHNHHRAAAAVEELPPGYGVMLATFAWEQGRSDFPPSRVHEDASYAADRLAETGYQAFVARCGPHRLRVGIRATSRTLAETLVRHISRTGFVELGDGSRLPVHAVEVVNLAELKAPAAGLSL